MTLLEPLSAAERHARGRARTTTMRSRPPTTENLTQQPAIRVDYQLSSKLRVHGQVLGPARAQADHAGHHPGIQRRAEPVSVHHELRSDGRLQMNDSTFLEGTYGFIRNQLAGGGSIGGSPARGGILVNESSNRLSTAGLSAALPECGRGRPALLRLRRPERPQPGLVRRQRRSTCRPRSRGAAASCRRSGTAGIGDLPGPPEPAVSRLPEHQPHAGRRDQPDQGVGRAHEQGRLLQQPQLQGAEHRRGRRAEPGVPGLRQLRQRHEQRARHRLRLRQRGGRACSRSTSSSRS